MSGTFDRLRPRAQPSPETRPLRLVAPGTSDAEGKRRLFSATEPPLGRGCVLLDCPRCGVRSVLSPLQALRNAVPSLHLPVVRENGSWMRCPACRRRGWVRTRVRV